MNVTHQGAACDTAIVQFDSTVRRINIEGQTYLFYLLMYLTYTVCSLVCPSDGVFFGSSETYILTYFDEILTGHLDQRKTDQQSESRDPFLKFCPNHIFGIGEAAQLKYRVLIDTEEYWCTQDIITPERNV